MFRGDKEQTLSFNSYFLRARIVEAQNNILFDMMQYTVEITMFANFNTAQDLNYSVFLTLSEDIGAHNVDWVDSPTVNIVGNYNGSSRIMGTSTVRFNIKIQPDDCCNIPVVKSKITITALNQTMLLSFRLMEQKYLGFSIYNQFEDSEVHSSELNISVSDWDDLPITAPTKDTTFKANRFSDYYDTYTVESTDYEVDFEYTGSNVGVNHSWISELKKFWTQFKLFGKVDTSDCDEVIIEPNQFLLNFDWLQDFWYPTTIEDVITLTPTGPFPKGRLKFNLINGYGVNTFPNYVSNKDDELLTNIVPVRPIIEVFFHKDDLQGAVILNEAVTKRKIIFSSLFSTLIKNLNYSFFILTINNACKTICLQASQNVLNEISYNMPEVKDVDTHTDPYTGEDHPLIYNLGGVHEGSYNKNLGNEYVVPDDVVHIDENIVTNGMILHNNKQITLNFLNKTPGDTMNYNLWRKTNREKKINNDFVNYLPSKMSIMLSTVSLTLTLNSLFLNDASDWIILFNNYSLSDNLRNDISFTYNERR